MTGEKGYRMSASYNEGINDHLSGLRYALMIQQALMPSPEKLSSLLKNHFIFFKPRDIVSGDFYYAAASGEYVIVAAGDCTGHGVPGALLSILGISFLNEIIQMKVVPRANRILNRMREKMMVALNQKGVVAEKKDSIDIAICVMEPMNGIIQYAGANRPLIMIRDGRIKEFKPDKMPIGVAPLEERSFTNHRIELAANDTFYLFSDGYIDQFGGERNKKFKSGKFREMLLSLQEVPMSMQPEIIERTFYDWKGLNPQVDDILIFGFEI
jgi:serine phosphatase RsbU (regulator of sigma subunit)